MGLLALALALVTGCGGQGPATVGGPPPELSVLDMADEPVELSDYQGKVIVLRFWSATCAACLTEMPQIERIYRAYRDRGFVMLGVNMSQDKTEVQAFAAEGADHRSGHARSATGGGPHSGPYSDAGSRRVRCADRTTVRARPGIMDRTARPGCY